MPTGKNKDLIEILGQRLREFTELDATRVLPAEIELRLQWLKRAESGDGSRGLSISDSDVSEQST